MPKIESPAVVGCSEVCIIYFKTTACVVEALVDDVPRCDEGCRSRYCGEKEEILSIDVVSTTGESYRLRENGELYLQQSRSHDSEGRYILIKIK